mmetsp:Transcript_15658/g.33809  ORF Transcript_15658/g.33809 Transcript_15658/m.33809 type:complete len:206 (-) Transcript_15658:437-1054(-)
MQGYYHSPHPRLHHPNPQPRAHVAVAVVAVASAPAPLPTTQSHTPDTYNPARPPQYSGRARSNPTRVADSHEAAPACSCSRSSSPPLDSKHALRAYPHHHHHYHQQRSHQQQPPHRLLGYHLALSSRAAQTVSLGAAPPALSPSPADPTPPSSPKPSSPSSPLHSPSAHAQHYDSSSPSRPPHGANTGTVRRTGTRRHVRSASMA